PTTVPPRVTYLKEPSARAVARTATCPEAGPAAGRKSHPASLPDGGAHVRHYINTEASPLGGGAPLGGHVMTGMAASHLPAFRAGDRPVPVSCTPAIGKTTQTAKA